MLVHKLALICILDIVLVGTCTPHKTLLKEISNDESYISRKRAEYESNHIKNHSVAANKQWPVIIIGNEMEEVCQKYVGVLFSKESKTVLTANIYYVWLHYLEIKDVNVKHNLKLFVKALQCEIFPPFANRKVLHFVKSPSPDCLYLCSLWRRNSYSHYVITEEICLGKTYDAWKICFHKSNFKRKWKRKKKHEKSYDDDPQERKEYESNHLDDYKLKQIEYVTWPAMENKDIEKRCKVLIEQFFPGNKHTIVSGEVHSVKLRYIKLENVKYEKLKLKVGAFRCQLPQKKQRNRFDFIRTPRPDCVHLIKKTSPRCGIYYISKQICEGQRLYKKPKRINSQIQK